MIRVIVVDDHAVVRQGLRRILEDAEDIAVVGEAALAKDALERQRESSCDVLVTDVTLPDRDGLALLGDVKREWPSLPVLVLSVHAEEEIAVRALKAGASGYLTKDVAPEQLVQAIREVYAGRRYLTPAVAQHLARRLGPSHGGPPHEGLSEREFQVMVRIARGQKPQRIALDLKVSPKTIATYRRRLLAKLGVQTAADIVAYCLRHNLSV